MFSFPPGLSPFQFGPFDVLLGAFCVAAIASVIIFILVAVWVYRDAEMRGMDGNVWAIVFVLAGFFVPFVGGIVVLIVYPIMRSEHPVLYAPGAPGAPYAVAPSIRPRGHLPADMPRRRHPLRGPGRVGIAAPR